MSATNVLKVGDQFSSFREFEDRLKQYECEVLNNYIIKDSLSLERHRERYPRSNIHKGANQNLKYYHARYSCLKGGTYKPRAKVRKTKTFRQGCEAGLFLKISSCGQYLCVKQLNENHNHQSSPELFKTLKNQRLNLPEEMIRTCSDALKVGKDKKMIQDEIIAKSGCLVTLKDIRNMDYVLRHQKKGQNEGIENSGLEDPTEEYHNKDNNGFKSSVESLVVTHKCDVVVEVDEKNNLKCLFFQDENMKRSFASFPEVIFVDGTQCYHENIFATYIFMVEDAVGNGVVVGVGILCQEDDETLDWFIKTFKEKNEKSSEVQVILTDKESNERSVLAQNFPMAVFVISLFHTLQTFNREISPKTMPNMTQGECDTAKEFFQKLAYASTEDKYLEIWAEMRQRVAKPALDYFDQNWRDIKEQWALCFTFSNMSFLNRKNNRIEYVIQKVKFVILRYSSLADFIDYFFVALNAIRVNQNDATAQSIHKVPAHKFPYGSPEECYIQLLTDFAFEKVSHELESTEHCKKAHEIDEDLCLIESPEGLLEVRKDTCECLFFKCIKLPCRHIFKARSVLNLPLFDDTLCLQRWRKDYLLNNHPLFNSAIEHSLDIEPVENTTKRKELSSLEKFQKMQDLFTRLAKLSAEVPTEVFYERMAMLGKLYIEWGGKPQDLVNDETSFGKENFLTVEEVVIQEDIPTLDDIKLPLVRPQIRPKRRGATAVSWRRKLAKFSD